MRVLTQITPNPAALKFITEKDMKNNGNITISKKEECLLVPLAFKLFENLGVAQLFFFENSITITLKDGYFWDELEKSITKIIEEMGETHDPNFNIIKEKANDKKELNGVLKEIDEILDRTIRPGLQGDGGDLEIVKLDGKILTVSYQGACTTCPSAISGTLGAIQSILQEEYDPEIEVITNNDYF